MIDLCGVSRRIPHTSFRQNCSICMLKFFPGLESDAWTMKRDMPNRWLGVVWGVSLTHRVKIEKPTTQEGRLCMFDLLDSSAIMVIWMTHYIVTDSLTV